MGEFRRWLADFLRMLADAIEPVRTIEWGPSLADAPITVGKPIQLPDEWLDWPGKAQGEPRPSVLFAEVQRELASGRYEGMRTDMALLAAISMLEIDAELAQEAKNTIRAHGDLVLPRDPTVCRAKLDGTLPPGCMLRDDEENR